MVELFNTTKQNISLHVKNIFSEGELDENSVVKEYLTTANDNSLAVEVKQRQVPALRCDLDFRFALDKKSRIRI